MILRSALLWATYAQLLAIKSRAFLDRFVSGWTKAVRLFVANVPSDRGTACDQILTCSIWALDFLRSCTAGDKESEKERVLHRSLPARSFVFAADPRNVVGARNPRNRSVLLRLCGGPLWNLYALFFARHKEQCESYCYVTHSGLPGFDYTPEGI